MLNKIFLTKQFITKKIKEKITKIYSVPLNEIKGNHIFFHKLFKRKYSYIINKNDPLVFELINPKKYYVKELKNVLEGGISSNLKNTEGLRLLEKALKYYNEGSYQKTHFFNILDVLLPYKKEEVFNINTYFYDEVKEIHNPKETTDIDYYDFIFPKNREVVTYLLSNPYLSDKEKRAITYVCLSDLINYSYIFRHKINENNVSLIDYIEFLLDTPYIWKDRSDSYLLLKKIFSSDLDEMINYKSLIICYNAFANLHPIDQKEIAYSLIKRNKETTLFNLLSYGIDLNWEINKEGCEKSKLGLEMFSNLSMIKMALSSNKFDITNCDSEGRSILYLLGGMAIENKDVKDLIIKRVQELDLSEKYKFLYKIDRYNRTAMDKAISSGDETLVEFLGELGVSPFYYIVEINRNSFEFLEFLLSLKIEGENKLFYEKYYKKWSSIMLQKKLEKELKSEIKNKSKPVKI